jgi:hypothetical protein
MQEELHEFNLLLILCDLLVARGTVTRVAWRQARFRFNLLLKHYALR